MDFFRVIRREASQSGRGLPHSKRFAPLLTSQHSAFSFFKKWGDALRSHTGLDWRFAIGFLIAVLALGIFGLFAIPQTGSRPTSTYGEIINNLRVINNQKQLWAATWRKGDNDTPSAADLAPYFSNGKFPTSVMGETYNINNVGTPPTATVPSRLETPQVTIEAGGAVALPDQ